VVSQRSVPSSIKSAASVAVMAFVHDPMWNRSLVVTGVESPTFRTPAAARSRIRPSFTTTTASAGRAYRLRIVSTTWSVSADDAARVASEGLDAAALTPSR